MKESIDQFIKSQGWSLYGIVTYPELKKVLQKHEGIFDGWVKKGLNAGMKWLHKMKVDRYHPEHKLPDIKSVIVLGAWYGKSEQKMCSINEGRVARYAVGKDYHKVLKKKLLTLSERLKKQNPKINTYISVDSGPTVDRVLAEAAGIGFFGKNSMIISPSRGSYFFIASVMTNINLKATHRSRMPSCGNCTRCMDKCPTGAIVAPGVIDARKCIAYLTIENKGSIPPKLRSKIGNRLFGCDTCQEVCPFNIARAHQQKVLIKEFTSEYGVGESLNLREVLAIKTDEEFTRRFAGTPLMRAKRKGLIRNARIVSFNAVRRVVE
ncbi:MAG: tRNA epoxyqueuosine(34) reductase QueG [Candidatus Peregrinibacteria bacterium]